MQDVTDEDEEKSRGQHSTLWDALPEGSLFAQVLLLSGLLLFCCAYTVQSTCTFFQQHHTCAVSISDLLSTPCPMHFLGQSILQVCVSSLGRHLQLFGRYR